MRLINNFSLPAIAVVLAFGHSTCAVVIDVGDGTANVQAPDDDPGFANVGIRGGGTGIYLGNRWVLTAAHVRQGSITLDGTTYASVIDQSSFIPNPPTPEDAEDELSVNADLMLIRLVEDPGLPSLRLGCDTVSSGSEVLMIGGGRQRVADLSFWDVEILEDDEEGNDNDIWTEVAAEEDSNVSGYHTTNSRSVRWGTNIVDEVDVETESEDWGNVLSFSTIFDSEVDTDALAQGVQGDSGGAVFQKNGGVWELVGVMHAVSLLDNQPEATRTAMFGNITFSADLAVYADAIRELADFEPPPGDANGNGIYESTDIDLLQDAIRDPDHFSCHFDLDGDGAETQADLQQLLTLANSMPGDTNLDGIVGFSDFLTMASSYGAAGNWGEGNFNGDELVDFDDFLILSNVFAMNNSTSAGTSVPEPATSWPFGVALFILAAHPRIRRAMIEGA